jgi:hypothetical protein
MDMVGIHAVFGFCPGTEINLLWKSLDLVEGFPSWWTRPTTTFDNCPDQLDVLAIPMLAPETTNDPDLVAFVAEQGRKAKYVIGVCNGVVAHRRRLSDSAMATKVLVQAGAARPPPGFVAGLTRSLAVFATLIVLDSNAAVRAGPGVDAKPFANWLAEVEGGHDLVLCIADPEVSPWTKGAIHGADKLLQVASGGPSTLNPVEAFALDLFPPKRRCLATIAQTRPPATACPGTNR